jgi:hypothetical protein
MPIEEPEADIVWHRRLGRRLAGLGVEEGRTRGAYLNGRIVWVLGLSLVAAVLVLAGVFVFRSVI